MELTDAEASAAYACAKPDLIVAYARSGVMAGRQYVGWTNHATTPYQSATHGGRYVNNYANGVGADYGRYEDAGTLPEGSLLAKDSFSVNKTGQVMVGPLFLMAKMAAGFNAGTGDWQYQMVMPNGTVYGTTGGAGSAKVQYCADCHNAMAEQDSLWFLPDEYRR